MEKKIAKLNVKIIIHSEMQNIAKMVTLCEHNLTNLGFLKNLSAFPHIDIHNEQGIALRLLQLHLSV